MAYMVNVYENGEIIGRVKANKKLDTWDGHNYNCGETGCHLGITKLKRNGKFVLIHTYDWEGADDKGEVVSDKEALQAILKSSNNEILKKYFPNFNPTLEEED